MDDQIKISTDLFDIVIKISGIVTLINEVSEEYKKSAMDFVSSYSGGANEDINQLQTSLKKDIDQLDNYYGVTLESIRYTMREFLEKDKALASDIEKKFGEMIK